MNRKFPLWRVVIAVYVAIGLLITLPLVSQTHLAGMLDIVGTWTALQNFNAGITVGGAGCTGCSTVTVSFPAAGVSGTSTGSGWNLPATSAMVPATYTGTYTLEPALQANSGGNQTAQNEWLIPTTLANGAQIAQLRFEWWSDSTGSGVVYQLNGFCYTPNGSVSEDQPYATAIWTSASLASTTAYDHGLIVATSVNLPAGCVAGSKLKVQLKRTDSGSVAHAFFTNLELAFH